VLHFPFKKVNSTDVVGYEILSVPVRQVHRLQVPENKKLRKIFGHAQDEVRVSGYYVKRVNRLLAG
jgi:hypothetical protein